MKLRVQQSMYWLGINKDIEDHVMSCDPCQVNGRSQQKEPILPFEVPNRPWQRVGIDLFHHNKGWYVIVADYYSKYPWIQALPATTSKDVISALKSCFAEYGIPEDVISDKESVHQPGVPVVCSIIWFQADHKQPSLPKRSWVCRATGANHQEATNQVHPRWVLPIPSTASAENHPN